MWTIISFWVFLLVCSWLFALLEIQIEGGVGWAASLPTWRIQNRWTKPFFGDKPLTGYHLYALTFVLLMSHAPLFLSDLAPTPKAEARCIAFYILFWVVEDFLWFVLNPAYGIRKFRRANVWWHSGAWWWVMPRDYWLYTPVGISLFWLSI